jgi:G:T-mismatch repair DNA endonuclease (very short patch repair protein)
LRSLRRLGWKCLLVWECETKNRARLASRLKRFLAISEPQPKAKPPRNRHT